MVLQVDEMIKVVEMVVRQEGVQVALRQSAKGAVVAGSIAFLGGLVAGPVGIAAGGAVGGLVGMSMTQGTFRPLADVIQELPAEERRRLSEAAAQAVAGLDWTDAAQLVALLMSGGSVEYKRKFVGAVVRYITTRLQAEVRHYND